MFLDERRKSSWMNPRNPFEIKLGANQIEQAAVNLLKIKNDLLAEKAKTPSVLCVLCGLSNAAYLREDGVYVIPLTALKQ